MNLSPAAIAYALAAAALGFVSSSKRKRIPTAIRYGVVGAAIGAFAPALGVRLPTLPGMRAA